MSEHRVFRMGDFVPTTTLDRDEPERAPKRLATLHRTERCADCRWPETCAGDETCWKDEAAAKRAERKGRAGELTHNNGFPVGIAKAESEPADAPDQGGLGPTSAPAPDRPVLRIAEGFTLPIEVAGEAVAILAKRGAGKTNTGRVLAEELHRAGVQIVVLDPVGVWWGARASRDGSEPGLPVPILGGEHADVDLKPSGGEDAARVAVESGASLIIDLSEFPRDEQREFVGDFATELYARKRHVQALLHVILEEADEFAPQAARGGASREETSRMRGAVETLARRGRSRGIGMTMITQRSAGLSKDVLTQADVLVAMRTTGPTDIRAIEAWVAHHGDAGDRVVSSLSALKTGEAWVWNPERDLLARLQVRLADTFDSSSTPRFGEPRVDPKELAPVALPLGLGDVVGDDRRVDHRRQDADGKWGCKIPGCEGRSSSRAGPYAFLCDDVHARGQTPPEPEPRATPAPAPPPLPAVRATPAESEAVTHGEELLEFVAQQGLRRVHVVLAPWITLLEEGERWPPEKVAEWVALARAQHALLSE